MTKPNILAEQSEAELQSSIIKVNTAPSLGTTDTSPCQPILFFPSHGIGKNKRSFQSSWYKLHVWLEYDISTDASFCYACRCFTTDSTKGDDAFTSRGCSNWKKALQKFKDHSTSEAHCFAMERWALFKSTKRHGTVVQQADNIAVAQIQERWDYLKRLFHVVIFLGKQALPFRGHDETETSSNKGNFIELLSLLNNFDPFLQEYEPPKNATYTSPISQNEIIESAAASVTKKIITDINKSKYFAIMADDSRDISAKEQMSICVRYIKENKPCESFLKFQHVTELDAQSLTNALCTILDSLGVTATCVAQAYDGASVMSGHLNGVQEKFRQQGHPMAIYTHCFAHKLNLVLISTCQSNSKAASFFDFLQGLHAYFSLSVVHHQGLIDIQKKLGIKEKIVDSLSTTRWSSHINAVRAVKNTYAPLLDYLQNVSHGDIAKARGMFNIMRQFTIILCLFIFERLLGTASGVHDLLQKEKLDLVSAIEGIKALKITLLDYHENNRFEELYEQAVCFAKSMNISINLGESDKRKRKRSKHLTEYFSFDSMAATSQGLDESCLDYKIHVYLPILDRMIQELDKRFSRENCAIIKSINAFNPESCNFLNNSAMTPFLAHYQLEEPKEECEVARNFIIRKMGKLKPEEAKKKFTLVTLLDYLDPIMFPRLCQALTVALTIPVTSCSCERSFSLMKRLKTYIRATMGQLRMSSLATLSIESKILLGINIDDIIDEFAKMTNRRNQLLLPKLVETEIL